MHIRRHLTPAAIQITFKAPYTNTYPLIWPAAANTCLKPCALVPETGSETINQNQGLINLPLYCSNQTSPLDQQLNPLPHNRSAVQGQGSIITPACCGPRERGAWARPFSTLPSACRASQGCSPAEQAHRRRLHVRKAEGDADRHGEWDDWRCAYQNKYRNQEQGTGPHDRDEEALGIKVILAWEALPVLS